MAQRSFLGIGIALGAGIGAALGVSQNNLALGIGVGIALGVAIGLGLDARQNRKDGASGSHGDGVSGAGFFGRDMDGGSDGSGGGD